MQHESRGTLPAVGASCSDNRCAKSGQTSAKKNARSSFRAIAGLMSALLLLVGGCASLNVDSKDLVLAVKFDDDDWGEPDYSKHGYTEQDDGYHIFLKMKLKGPYKGSMLSITTTSLSDNAQKWRDENLKRLENPHVSANWKHIVAFKSPRGVGNRSAYGYSYYESDFRRWAQAWFVNCLDGYVCEVHLESPIDSGSFESKLSNILNEIKWKKRTVYG